MPYIKADRKKVLASMVKILGSHITDAGEFTYVIYALLKILTNTFGMSFKNLAGLMGCMECAKTEFYRRIVAPYEDQKIKENGDVE